MQSRNADETKELVNIISDLVHFRTVAGRDIELDKAANYIKNFFADVPVSIEEFDFNNIPALFITTRNTKRPHILFQGHLDVVEGIDSQFTPRIQENKLYGRGTVDMKGYVALSMQLIKELIHINNDVDAGLMLTFDEETGSENGASRLAEMGYSGNIILNGDGGYNDSVIYAEKGILKMKLAAKAEPGRHPYPWMGKNAFDILTQNYQRIRKMFPGQKIATEDDNWYTTYSVYDVNVKNEQQSPPHYAEMKMNIYFADSLSVDELFNNIKSEIKNIEIEKILGSERVYINPQNPYLHHFADVMRQQYKRDIVVRSENGSSDARFFTNCNSLIIIMKVVGEDHHGSNEHLDIPSLLPLYNTLKEFVLNNSEEKPEQKSEAVIENV